MQQDLQEGLYASGGDQGRQAGIHKGVEQRVVDDLREHAAAGEVAKPGKHSGRNGTQPGLVDNVFHRLASLVGHPLPPGHLGLLPLVLVVVCDVGVHILEVLRLELKSANIR